MTASDQAAPEHSPTLVRPSRAIGTAALIIMAGNLTSSGLGFVRLAVIDKVFGATHATDAFFAASIVPQMFYDLTIGAAISAALIPTFTEIVEVRGREAFWRTVSSVLAFAWLVLAVVVVILLVAARPLMSIIVPGFHQQHLGAGAFSLSVQIARVLVPSLFFLGTSAVLLSTLYSLRRFTAPAFATAFYHVGIIAGAAFLARPLGIIALPVGALAGSAVQVAVQVPALLRSRPHLRLHLELTPEIKRIIRLYAPVAAGLLVSIGGQIIDLGFKSRLASGGLSEMQNATTLTQFPIGIAVAAVSFAILPSISADAAFDRLDQFKDTLAAGMRLVLFITVPAAVGYIALSTPIVSFLFEHGHFRPRATAGTASALLGYGIQIPFVGIDQLLIFSFYARKNTVTPMLVGVMGVCIYIISALVLMPRFQILGLALANTIQNSLHGVVLLALLFSAFGTLSGRGILSSVTKTLIGAFAMAAGSIPIAAVIGRSVDTHHLAGQALTALVPITLGVALYIGIAAALRNSELTTVRDMVLRRGAL